MIRGAQILCLLVGATSRPEVRAPASVLFEDGCDGGECGTALLQSSMQGHRQAESKVKRKAAESVEEAVVFWENLTQMLENAELAFDRLKGAMKTGKTLRLQLTSQEDPKLLQLLRGHVEGFAFCDAQLQQILSHAERLESSARQWMELHQRCTHQAELFKQDPAEHRELQEKVAECTALNQVLRTTQCARATRISGMCDTYQTCRRSVSLASSRARATVHQSWRATHGSNKAQWVVEALRCFEDQWQSGVREQSVLQLALHSCEHKAKELLKHQDPPALHCNQTLPQGVQGCEDVLQPALGSILDRDLTKEMATGGVSLMQEGIELTEAPEEPPALVEMQEALAGPLATPICMLVAFFTLSMLGVRCWMTTNLRPGQKDASPKSVDAWCVNSLEKLADADQCWLCGELVVPKKTSCSIFVPSHQGSCLVTDKMGQSMFRTSRVRGLLAELKAGMKMDWGRMFWRLQCHVTHAVVAICCIDIAVVSSVRPHELRIQSNSQRKPESHNLPGNASKASDIKAACEEHVLDKGENVTVAMISKCVDALQDYARVTRNGLVESIDAEKEFVKHYAKAAAQIKKLGDGASIWDVAESDRDRALQVLLGDANTTQSLVVQLRTQNSSERGH